MSYKAKLITVANLHFQLSWYNEITKLHLASFNVQYIYYM